ncbi:MAG: hypothetical protein ISR96_09095 [Nitrospira sp.]|nr:hypothetical protein [bacterium]MBL7049656.1 hypothetical protein [Nitrospira sp.]
MSQKNADTNQKTSSDKAPLKMQQKSDHTDDSDQLESTHDKLDSSLHTLRDKLSKAAEKGVNAIKEVAEKIHLFADDATELTKRKIEYHNLQKEHEKLLILMGIQLRNMNKSNTLNNVKNKFKYDFQKLNDIETELIVIESEIEKLTSELKAIE